MTFSSDLARLAATAFPAPDEAARYLEHGRGLGYTHGPRVKRTHPCGLLVWPDDDGRETPREAMRGEAITCPRCLVAMRGNK